MSLHDITYDGDGLHHPDHRQRLGSVPLRRFVDEAIAIVERRRETEAAPLEPPDTTDDFEHLRWFPYPAEVVPAVGPGPDGVRSGSRAAP